jgi:DNA-binding response OmpR family regulator
VDKLLIVDDEDAMRRLLRINLADCYEIIDTGTSAQALSIAMQDKPSVILLDLRMPNYSGFELCRTFKAMSSTQLIPIIIISGEAGATTRLFCKELGAAEYFQKPVDFDALRASLTRVLRTARPERRSEIRVHLRIKLRLQGIDADGRPFDEESITENVSRSAFLCGCTAPLDIGSTMEVGLRIGKKTNFIGKVCVIRSQARDTTYPRYAFRFLETSSYWILQ